MKLYEFEEGLPTHILQFHDGSEIELISVVKMPAIGKSGIAMSNSDVQLIQFSANDEKMQIIAPILVTDTYPKQLDKDGNPYQIHIQEATVRDAHKQFAKRGETRVFNLEHTEMMLDGYILSSYVVDTPEEYDILNKKYGIELSTVSWIGVMQFEDYDQYKAMKKAGATSFSIEGPIASIILDKNKTINMSNVENKSLTFSFVNGKIMMSTDASKEEAQKMIDELNAQFVASGDDKVAEQINKEEAEKVEASATEEEVKEEVVDAIEDKVEEKVATEEIDALTAEVVREIVQEVISTELEFMKTKLMDIAIEKDKVEEKEEKVEMGLDQRILNLINSKF